MYWRKKSGDWDLTTAKIGSADKSQSSDSKENVRSSCEILGQGAKIIKAEGNLFVCEFDGTLKLINNYYQLSKPELNPQDVFPWGMPFIDAQPFFDQNRLISETKNALSNKRSNNRSNVACVYGDGWKKQRAITTHFIFDQLKEYKYLVWFSAEDTSKLDNQYSALGIRLGIFSESLPLEQKQEILKNWFERNPNWLLVYEKVEDYKRIEPYLPSSGGHIIITTKSSDLNLGGQCINVGKIEDENDCNSISIDLEENSKLVGDYIVRDQSANINELSNKLEKYGIVAITGIAGSGKTQLAYYYAYKFFRKRYPKSLIITIPCDSNEDSATVKTEIKKWLNKQYQDRDFVFILDGLDNLSISYKELWSFFPASLNPKRQQIIITSQKDEFFKDKKERNFPVDGFTDEEATQFINYRVPYLGKKDAIELVQAFFGLPLGLRCATLYIEDSKFSVSVDKYLDSLGRELKAMSDSYLQKSESELIKENDPYNKEKNQIAALRLSIRRLSIEAQYLLKCCSYFYLCNNIPHLILIDLLSSEFKLNNGLDKFHEVLREFKKYSLISRFDEPEKLSIHPVIQMIGVYEREMRGSTEEKVTARIIDYFNRKCHGLDSYINAANLLYNSDSILTKILECYLEKEVNLNKVNENGETALMIAIKIHHTEGIKMLLDKGAAIDKTNNYGWTALMLASSYKHTEAIKMLLEKGANVDRTDDIYNWTALMIASNNGCSETLKMLLEKGADVNKTDNDDWTALRIACNSGHTEIIKLLIEKGAGVDKADNDGCTALIYAACSGNTEVVKLLIEKEAGVDKADNDGCTALIYAAYSGNTEVVKLLLEGGADVDKTYNQHGWTALKIACDQGHTETVKLLLENGADVDKTDNYYNWTALQIACNKGHIEIVKLLIRNGANIDRADSKGWTALMYASYYGKIELVKWLLEKGADVNIITNKQQTAIILADMENYIEIIRLLSEKGAKIDKKRPGLDFHFIYIPDIPEKLNFIFFPLPLRSISFMKWLHGYPKSMPNCTACEI